MLTFLLLGTFVSRGRRIDRELTVRGLFTEQQLDAKHCRTDFCERETDLHNQKRSPSSTMNISTPRLKGPYMPASEKCRPRNPA